MDLRVESINLAHFPCIFFYFACYSHYLDLIFSTNHVAKELEGVSLNTPRS
jgi:hypothetical protein